MDVKKILEVIRKGVEFAEQLSPVLSLIPGAGAILATGVKAVGAVTEVVANIQERVGEGKIVLTLQDEAELKGYAQRLAAINDGLAAQIAADDE